MYKPDSNLGGNMHQPYVTPTNDGALIHSNGMVVYRCGNKRCREYRKEFTALNPSAVRQATGNSVRCNCCGDVAWFVRSAGAQS
jgi:alkyl sulfatase BDS1-like metallo-beta-lactamase superfamily hydrolase